jgi:hypothetical protein
VPVADVEESFGPRGNRRVELVHALTVPEGPGRRPDTPPPGAGTTAGKGGSPPPPPG